MPEQVKLDFEFPDGKIKSLECIVLRRRRDTNEMLVNVIGSEELYNYPVNTIEDFCDE